MKNRTGNQHQKNLKVILSMEQIALARWLADLPDEEIVYVEWLIEEVESALDEIVLQHSGLIEATEVLDEIRRL